MKSILSLVVLCLISLFSVPSFAVGPELPAIPKYSAFDVTGRVTFIANIFPFGPPCPPDYVERVLSIFNPVLNGSVKVVLPEGVSDPDTSSCIRAIGMPLPSCSGQTILVVESWAVDGSCDF